MKDLIVIYEHNGEVTKIPASNGARFLVAEIGSNISALGGDVEHLWLASRRELERFLEGEEQ